MKDVGGTRRNKPHISDYRSEILGTKYVSFRRYEQQMD